MKKITIILIILLTLTNLLSSQTIKKPTMFERFIPKGKVFNLDKETEILTTNTAIYKQKTYPVYCNGKGKLFIKVINPKTNKEYKKYIKNV